MKSICIRLQELGDSRAMARIHLSAFPRYYSSYIGLDLLTYYYTAFCTQPGIGVVAVYSDSIIGFAAASICPEAVLARFVRGNSLELMRRLCHVVLDDPALFWATLKRWRSGFAMLMALARPVRSISIAAEVKRARLLSIAVDPAFRRQGIGTRLVLAIGDAVALEYSVAEIGLSVYGNNAGAISFYMRTGWNLDGASEAGMQFWRPVNAPL